MALLLRLGVKSVTSSADAHIRSVARRIGRRAEGTPESDVAMRYLVRRDQGLRFDVNGVRLLSLIFLLIFLSGTPTPAFAFDPSSMNHKASFQDLCTSPSSL
jgi:hypothetical protein